MATRHAVPLAGTRAAGLVEEASMHAQTADASAGSEGEAAKRLALGATAGKHAQRTAALRLTGSAHAAAVGEACAMHAGSAHAAPPGELPSTAAVQRGAGLGAALRAPRTALDVVGTSPVGGLQWLPPMHRPHLPPSWGLQRLRPLPWLPPMHRPHVPPCWGVQRLRRLQ